MSLHTFRARSLAEALRLVREELGPDASVLHTREVSGGVARWLGCRTIEVTASADVAVPSRFADDAIDGPQSVDRARRDASRTPLPPAELHDYRQKIRADLVAAACEPSIVEQLAADSDCGPDLSHEK